MKERPILFSGPMVRAIGYGRKTQTRRVVKPQHGADVVVTDGKVWRPSRTDYDGYASCPHGQPGDRLWVRETWAIPDSEPLRGRVLPREDVAYAASCHLVDLASPSIHWRPSIHMPRWACRLVLEIIDVRVERLQDISEEDARAEGVHWSDGNPDKYGLPTEMVVEAKKEFSILWDSLAAPGARWEDSPWVWVIGFRRVEA